MSETAPAPGRRGRKVCIVGFAKTSRDLAPYADPAWEIWGVNDAWSFAHRADRWFEVHSTWIYEWELRRAKGHVDWLRAFGEAGGIVYLLEPRVDLPHAVAYPFEDVCNNLWPRRATEGDHKATRPYLTSSIAYMQALAIAEGFEDIAIVGVDMAADSEYEIQRPCCEFLVGIAEGRGIRMWLPEQCGLMTGPLYGRGAMNPEGERISQEQLGARLKRLEQHEARAIQSADHALGIIQQIKGALINSREMLGEHPTAGPTIKARIDNLEQQLQGAQHKWGQHMEALNQVRGALIEVRYWIGLTPHGGDARLLPPVLLPPAGQVAANDGHGPDPIGVDAEVEAARVTTIPFGPSTGALPKRTTRKRSPNGAASEALEVAHA